MAVVAKYSLVVGDALAKLSADIQQAQMVLGARLSELNTELGGPCLSEVADRRAGAMEH